MMTKPWFYSGTAALGLALLLAFLRLCSPRMGGPIAEPEVHLLPSGFVGHVAIHHARADGGVLEREGDARLYRIPSDGVLATPTKANYGVRPPEQMKFFWVDAEGRRTPIPRRDAAGDSPCLLGFYQVGPVFHYFVDRIANEGRYKNPAIVESPERG